VFPFLIGTVRTKIRRGRSKTVRQVSIPHRYGKNFYPFVSVYGVHLFPFLIGTVRTRTAWMRCDTMPLVSIPHRYGKNRLYTFYFISFSVVSIPHRYGKNRLYTFYFISFSVVSIPHRYGKNTIVFTTVLLHTEFPFLIGTVRTQSVI